MPTRKVDLAQIVEQISVAGSSLIALDGLPGAGKSTLASDLSAALNIPAIHLDDFLEPGCVGFTESLRYEDLRRALLRRPVIVEGVCLLDVLDRLELRADHFIYVSAHGAERELDRDHPLVRDVRAYTKRARPLEQANLLFSRSEGQGNPFTGETEKRAPIDAFLMRNRSRVSFGLLAAGTFMLALGALLFGIGSSASRESLPWVEHDFPLVGAGFAMILISSVWILLVRSTLPSTRLRSPKPGP